MEHSSNLIKTQVVIVGAGPTGLSMAAQLLRLNIDFMIIEKNTTTTPLSKALVVQARTLEIFQELGIAEKAVNEGEITSALNLFYQGRKRATINIQGAGQGLSAFPYALSLEQCKTEALLVQYLSAHNKQVNWNCELIHFEQNDDSVIVTYKDAQGQLQKVKAAYLVGCDGAGSIIRHQLDIPFEGTTVPKLFYVADVILSSPVINKNELYANLIKQGFVLFFPMEGAGHYRIVGVLPSVEDMEKKFEFADVLPSIREILYAVTFQELRWFSTYKVHSRKAHAFIKGRCFLAGDAAHIHTPAGGQGMNTGIQDAYNLAWKMAYALRGEINDEVLHSYHTERAANAKHLLQTTDRMFDMLAGTNPFFNFLRLYFFPLILNRVSKSKLVRNQLFPLISQIGITYPDSYLTVESSVGKVKAGDRIPYFVFADGTSIFDYITEPVFKLLYFGNGYERLPGMLNNVNIKLVHHIFHEIPQFVFGREKNFYILLRPDNHISYIGQDIDQCKMFIDKITLR